MRSGAPRTQQKRAPKPVFTPGQGRRPESAVYLTKPERLVLTVHLTPDTSIGQLAEHGETIQMFTTSMLDRMVSLRDVNMSEPVGMYTSLAAEQSEMVALLRDGALEPMTKWNRRLSAEGALKMRSDFSIALSRALTQLELVRAYAEDADLLGEGGKPAYWAAVGLYRLLAATGHVVERWGKLLAFEARHFAPKDVDSITAQLARARAGDSAA